MNLEGHRTAECGRSRSACKIQLVVLLVCATVVAVPTVQAQQIGLLVVELTGMKNDDGSLVYAMWSGPENWLEADPIRDGSVPIENGTSMIRMSDLPYGEYAISVYHDRNGNSMLDTGFLRIPKEPIGTSNDAKIRFGPPKYDDAVFLLEDPELTITIHVKKVF